MNDQKAVADPKTVILRLLARIDRLERLLVRLYEREDCQSEMGQLQGELYSRQGYWSQTTGWYLEQMADQILGTEGE